jgi:hypothetical protein
MSLKRNHKPNETSTQHRILLNNKLIIYNQGSDTD